jgi:hypothetical protein
MSANSSNVSFLKLSRSEARAFSPMDAYKVGIVSFLIPLTEVYKLAIEF